MNTNSFETSIDKTLKNSLKHKVVNHKKRFKEIFKARYMELLPSLIKYKNSDMINVDFLKVEVALRSGYDVVIGETENGLIQVIGFATSNKTTENPADLFSENLLKHGQIKFIIDEKLQLDYYKEISNLNNCEDGNFIVLRNKTLNYIDDKIILNHYIDELAEIVLSRFSISMQVKILTLFLSDQEDENMNKLISDLYNGIPYSTGSKLFDPEEQIYHMKNDGLAQNFQELKREYQNKISELNNMLGMNSLAVEKSSGVSDEEAKSNRAYTTSNANIYLDGRNHGLEKLNKRYGFKLEAMYNDEVVSEFNELVNDEVGDDDDNNNII